MFLEHIVVATGITGGCINGACAVPVAVNLPAVNIVSVVADTPRSAQITVEYRRNIFGRLKPIKARTKTQYQALIQSSSCKGVCK